MRYNPASGQAEPVALAVYANDGQGRLSSVSDPRIPGGFTTSYTYDSGDRLQTITPPGEAPWTLSYNSTPGDDNGGRLESVKRPHPTLGTDSKWSVRYNVPLAGSGGPRDMSPSALAAWGEVDDLPTDATAIFPPDQVPPAVPTSWTKATVHYLDADGHEVNTLEPGGALSASKYDANGNVQWTLSAANRARAVAAGGDTATKALQLTTTYSYAANGVDETERLGPRHLTRLKDGSTIYARTRTVTNYDYANSGNPAYDWHLPTSVLVEPKPDSGVIPSAEKRITKLDYNHPDGSHRGWALRRPTKVTVDSADAEPGRLNLTTSYVYDAALPLLRSKRTPGSTGGGNRETTYRYWGIDPSACGTTGADGVTGLVCKTTAPEGSHTFNYTPDWDENVDVETLTGSSTTTATLTYYDQGARPVMTTTSGGNGTAVPAVWTEYDAASRVKKVTTYAQGSDPTRTIEKTFDSNGRVTDYKDADGEHTTSSYDIVGRPAQVTDSKGSTTYAYDDRGLTSSVLDSTIGSAIAGSYDADGQLTAQTLPNGLTIHTAYNEEGSPIELTHTRSGCTTGCSWPSQQLSLDVTGRWMTETSDSRTRSFSYDGAGRLLTVAETPTGGVCTTTTYSYDADSNRTFRKRFPAATSGGCSTATTPATQALTVNSDGTDRLNASGFAHDNDMRVTTVPGTATGGSTLNASYFTNDRTRSISQAGYTETYGLDPVQRNRSRIGNYSGTAINHFADDSDSPSWTADPGGWTRYIGGVDGELVATRSSTGTTTYLLNDLHGDTVATVGSSTAVTHPIATTTFDEFGVPAAPKELEFFGTSWTDPPTEPISELTLTRPSFTQAGDLLLAEISADNDATISAPAGWQLVPGSSVTIGDTELAVYSHRLGSGDPIDITLNMSSAGFHLGELKAFRNADPDQPPTAASAESFVPSITALTPRSAISVFVGANFDIDPFAATDVMSDWGWPDWQHNVFPADRKDVQQAAPPPGTCPLARPATHRSGAGERRRRPRPAS